MRKTYTCENCLKTFKQKFQRKTPCGLNINVETIVKKHCEIILTDLINKFKKNLQDE